MKMRLLLFLLIINCLARVYGEQIQFVYHQESYTINSQKPLENLFRGYPPELFELIQKQTTEVDSIIRIESDCDSIFVFIRNHQFIAYCIMQNGEFLLLDSQVIVFEQFKELKCLDINNDKVYELVSICSDIDEYSVSIRNYIKSNNEFVTIYNNRFDNYEGYSLSSLVKIRKNKLYFAYGFYLYSFDKMLLKFGKLDYSKDESKEIYFKPISITTLKLWERF